MTAKVEGASERCSVYYGQWAGSFLRAELARQREIVTTFLGDCEERPESQEAEIAYLLNGETHWFAGNFIQARPELERALALFDPERDRELAFRFGQDVNVIATNFLACGT